MADKKISQLTALAAANVASATDVLAIVDTSATETKKITAKDLIDGALNGGTANGVLYLNGSKVATSGSALTFDGTNLGIGTASPGAKLHVAGEQLIQPTTASNAKLSMRHGSVANNNYFEVDSSGNTIFGTVNAERMRLDSSGNLGLGVTPSAWVSGDTVLQVKAGSSTTALWGRNNTGRLITNAYFDGTNYKYVATAAATILGMNVDGGFDFAIAPSGTAGNNITGANAFVQAMTLTSGALLQVAYPGNTSFYAQLDASDGNGHVRAPVSGMDLVFDVSGSERARITSDGDFLVGKTATAATTVGVQLVPAGTITATRSGSSNATSTMEVYSTGAGAYRFYVGMDGTVNATNTTISAISDQRFKENIRDLDVGLEAILALKPRKFDWKAGQGKDIKDDRGFIAQEFEQVFPDLVDEWKDPAPEGEEPYKSVRQDLIPVLVKAMQEQQSMIETLKAKVSALEAK